MNKFIRTFLALLLISCTLLSFATTTGASENLESNKSETESPFYNLICSYNGADNIRIEYRMKSKDVKEYEDYVISVYMLTPPYELDDILSGKLEPVKTNLSPSNRSSIDIKVPTLAERLSRYVLTVGNGEILICSEPIYPSLNNSVSYSSDFKGIASSDIYDVIDSTAGTVIVDIDADKLEGRGSGYLFTVGDKTYIFNSTYLAELDRKFNIYGGAGIDIYLRLCSEKNKTLLLDGQTSSLQSIYAYVSFLFTRYSSDELKGLILGTSEDTAQIDCVQNYAAALYSAVAAVSDLGKKVTSIVPVGDVRKSTEDFLSELCNALKTTGGPYFTVMIESDKNPSGINIEYTDSFDKYAQSLEKAAKPMLEGLSSEYISAENIVRFNSFLNHLSAEGGHLYTSIIYFWNPDTSKTYGNAAEAAYVYNYYKFFFLNSVSALILSLDEFKGTDKDISALENAVRYINTNKRTEYIEDLRIAHYYDLGDWPSEIKNFSFEKLNEKKLISSEPVTETPGDIIGQYDYFDFSSVIGTGGWYSGNYCSSLTSGKNDFGKALVAKLDTNGDGSAFIAYNYKIPENFKYTDYISLSFSVENIIEDEKLDFCITLVGNGFEYDYTVKDVLTNTRHTAYLDVSQMDEQTPVENIRIALKGHADESVGLYVYSIGAASRQYDSKKLFDLIESERERLSTESEQNDTVNRFAIAFVVVVVLATGVVMITISRRKKNTKN